MIHRRHLRVMMLGWEYPPRLAGGLGKACQGLSQAMAKQGVQIYFVLPTFPQRFSEPKLEVVGAREVMIEAGWQSVDLEEAAPSFSAQGSKLGAGAVAAGPAAPIQLIRSSAQLAPYASPSEVLEASQRGVADHLIWKMMEDIPARKEALRQVFQKTTTPIYGERPAASTPPAQEIYGKNLWSEIERFSHTVRHLAGAHEVDVLHAHDWMTFPAAFEFHKITGVPVFLHVHATEYDRSGENINSDVFRIEREGFRRANHIFAVSRYTAGIIERLYGVHPKKISVVYNAPEHEGSELIASPDSPRDPNVVFLGRLTFQKGPDHFLKAAALVAKAHPRARFVICGTGDMMDQLRSQAHQLGIEDRVHFAGFVDPSGVDTILQRSKVLVMPSVSEPFGLVALEAIRCGLPVILSKQSGVREVLARALQVDFWDTEKLADQIHAALSLPDLSRQLVGEGLEQMQQLSWDKSASRVIHVYKNLIGSTFSQALGGGHGH